MTFSLIGRSKDGNEWGVAVASKFLGVGAYVPAAEAEVGALATQAFGNLALRTRGLAMLKDGMMADVMVQTFLADDPQREERQIGVVDAHGNAVTFTGNRCLPWAGGQAENHPRGAYAAQGNMLAGKIVVDAMVQRWLDLENEPSLARRLVLSLEAGQDAGGDPRGKQAAAVLTVAKGKGYGGLSDVVVDLREDDSPEPIPKLLRMLDEHDLYFGSTPENQLLPLDDVLSEELRSRLAKLGHNSGNVAADLYIWMGIANYEMRYREGKVDPVVLAQLRQLTDK